MGAKLPWRHRDTEELDGRRRTARMSSLPGARAVVGGLLVATSATLLFAAYRDASAEPTQRWLIVQRGVAAGSTIEASDLGLATMDLHPQTAQRALTDPDDVIGRTATATLDAGDLVQRSDLADDGGLRHPTRRVSLELGRAAALNGDLAVGDAVEVVALAADGTGAEVLTDGEIAALSDELDGGLGSSDRLIVTLTVPDVASAQAIVAAQDAGGVTLLGAGPAEARVSG